MIHAPRLPGPQQGLSLVELMVAMTIGLLLSVVTATVYSQSSRTYNIESNLSRLQEGGRTALDLIVRDLRMASYRGCNGAANAPSNVLNNAAGYAYNFGVGVQAFYGGGSSWTPAPPADFPVPAGASQSSDVITIRRAETLGSYITAPYPTLSTDPLTLPAGNNVKTGDVLMVADCASAAIFQATSTPGAGGGTLNHAVGGGAPGNASADLIRAYGSNSEVARMSTITYYTAPSQFGVGPSLWRVVNTNAPEELVENVETLRVQYGVDTDTPPDYSANSFVVPSAAVVLANVISLRVSISVRTDQDALATKAQTYYFNGAPVVATDLRLRRGFTATVNLRNRTL